MRSLETPLMRGGGRWMTAAALCLSLAACSGAPNPPQEHSEPAPPPAQASAPAPATPPPARPNVVFILLDALRAGQLDAQRDGIALMPRLSAFAAHAMRFSHVTAQATWTKPSMASVFTSLYPEVHNVQLGIAKKVFDNQIRVADKLPERFVTLAEVLRDAGYFTAAIQTNVNLKPIFGFDQGFSRYTFATHLELPADKLTAAAIAELKQATAPFFLYLHYMDVHAPYISPETYREGLTSAPPATEQDLGLMGQYNEYYLDRSLVDTGVKAVREKPNLSEGGRNLLRLQYDAATRFLDEETMRFVDVLLAEQPNTLLIITADHGEEFWDHGSVGHSKTVYEELTHVPLIISMPGMTPGVVQSPALLLDLAPTITGYLGIAPPSDWQGIDLFRQPPPPNRLVFSQTKTSLRESNVDLVAAWKENWKLIVDNHRQKADLYDLSQDPGERAPVNDPQRKAELLDAVKWFHEANKAHPCANAGQTGDVIDQTTLETLNAQGYF